jgi:hypothetical protein
MSACDPQAALERARQALTERRARAVREERMRQLRMEPPEILARVLGQFEALLR